LDADMRIGGVVQGGRFREIKFNCHGVGESVVAKARIVRDWFS